jgi:tRNA pseudouridine38-40 synthase
MADTRNPGSDTTPSVEKQIAVGTPDGARTIRLTVEYDGTDFHGWQTQPDVRTGQGVLNEALSIALRHPVRVVAASRTDAGVHAFGQVVSFETTSSVPVGSIVRAVGAHLPKDLAVSDAREVEVEFSARFSARGKWYRYRILDSRGPRPLEARTSHRSRWPLDEGRMREAASLLVGTHDFRGFAKCKEIRPTTRTLFSVDVLREGAIVLIDVRGEAFLYNMVRILAGTLLEVGRGARSPSIVGHVLRTGDRGLAGPTLPGCGLFLVEVFY